MKKLLFAAAAAATLLAASASPAAEVFDYQLNGTLADANAGADLVNNGAALGANGLTFDNNQGPSLALSGGVYSIETSFSLDDVGGFNKVLDFLDRGADTGVYVLNGALTFYGTGLSGGSFGNGAMAHLVVTRDAANLFTAYVNGAQALSFTDSGAAASVLGTLRFFTDDFATGQGEASAGFVDYIRTYDSALSGNQVAELYRTGGIGGGVPEPAAWALMLFGFGAIGATVRRRRALAYA